MFGVSILIFGLMLTFSPERRAAAFVSTPQMAKDIPVLIKKYGFDRPYHEQYITWFKQVTSGNLGYSLVASRSVLEAFWYYFPITLELNLYAAPCIILFGIWMGTIAGRKPNSFFDHFSRIFSIVGWSLPTFLFALVLIMVFYGYFSWFPPGIVSDEFTMLVRDPALFNQFTGMYTIDGILNGRLDVTFNALKHLVLPVITETIVICALLMRVMRSGMLEEMSKDYVITARAKGADEKTICLKHARPNALIPVITIAGQLVASLMEGSIAVEIVFNRQGLGWWLASSATQLDMPVLMSMCLFMAIVFVLVNLVVDILYAYVDPRIRLS
ncbi:MAG: ABC transporter permease [Desulfobacteraceae bacterium]|nr:ABC transporter permease [Desulfobacteraceae bacterium]